MAEGGDEIEAAVDPIINDVSAIEAALIMEVAFKLVVDVADDGAETGQEKQEVIRLWLGKDSVLLGGGSVRSSPVLAVDGVSVSRRVHHSEAKLHPPLLDLHRGRFDLDSSFNLLC